MTEQNPKTGNRGVLLILLAAFLWGAAGIFVRHLTEAGILEMQVVFLRASLSSLLFAVGILIKDPKCFRIRLKDLPLFICAGIFSIVLFNFCYYKTMALSTLAVAAVLLYTAPAFVILLSALLFREKLTVRKCAACLLSFIGCALVSGLGTGGGEVMSVPCLIFGLLTGFGYALYTVFSNVLIGRGYPSETITFYTFFFAAVGAALVGDPAEAVSAAVQHPTVLLWGLGMALFNTVIPYYTYTLGLMTVEAGKAPIIATLEPVVATLCGVILYHETMNITEGIGIVLVLGAIFLLKNRKKENS